MASFTQLLGLWFVSIAQLLTWSRLGLLVALSAISYVLALVIYRVYLSPLSAFPGPFLAKATHWYEFYYNFLQTGKYYERIREMHEKYGML